MFVTGVAVLIVARRRTTGDVMRVDTGVLAHDVRYFVIAYAIAIGAAFLPLEPVWLKWIVAVVLIGIYAWYVKGHFEADTEVDAEDLAPLRFHPLDRDHHRRDPSVPRLRIVNVQVLAALGLIILGAVFFVDAVEHLAHDLNVDSALLALVIAPIATELPEKFNSVIWVRQGKDTLAMGNITGAMVFQSTIPTVVALVFASDAWVATEGSYTAFASAGIAFISTAAIFIPMARRGTLRGRALLVGGVFYLAYLALIAAVIGGAFG
jgi:cation:H+ antiporter